DGGTVAPDGGVWNAAARTITWTVASLAPGATEPRSYDARVAIPAAASSVFTNTVSVTGTSLPDLLDDDGERTTYSATAQDTNRLEETTIAKTVDPHSATIGNKLTYTLDLTLQPNVTYFDTTILDTLPTGVVYDATTSITCVSGCPPAVTGTALPPQGQRVGWYLGDIPAALGARVVRVIYSAHVADTVNRGNTLTNAARAVYNTTDKIAGTPAALPDPASFD